MALVWEWWWYKDPSKMIGPGEKLTYDSLFNVPEDEAKIQVSQERRGASWKKISCDGHVGCIQ